MPRNRTRPAVRAPCAVSWVAAERRALWADGRPGRNPRHAQTRPRWSPDGWRSLCGRGGADAIKKACVCWSCTSSSTSHRGASIPDRVMRDYQSSGPPFARASSQGRGRVRSARDPAAPQRHCEEGAVASTRARPQPGLAGRIHLQQAAIRFVLSCFRREELPFVGSGLRTRVKPRKKRFEDLDRLDDVRSCIDDDVRVRCGKGSEVSQ